MPVPDIEDSTTTTLEAGDQAPNSADLIADFEAKLSGDSTEQGEPAPTPDAEASPAADPNAEPAPDAGEAPGETGEEKYTLDELTKLTGLSSPEEVAESLKVLNAMKEQLGGKELEGVIEQASKLEEMEKAWAIEDELKKRENETPEETIARLDEEREERDRAEQERLNAEEEAETERQVLEAYDVEVTKVLDATKNLDPLVKEFLANELASTNENNTFDPSKPGEVRSMAARSIEALAAFQRQTIQNYLDGKVEAPDITPTGGAAPAASTGPKTLKEAMELGKQMAKDGLISFGKK